MARSHERRRRKLLVSRKELARLWQAVGREGIGFSASLTHQQVGERQVKMTFEEGLTNRELPLIAGPWIFGWSIDHGIVAGDRGAVGVGAVALMAVTLVGAFFGIALHTLVVRTWLISLYGTTKMVTRKAAQMGHVLPRRSPAGCSISATCRTTGPRRSTPGPSSSGRTALPCVTSRQR